MVGSIVGRDLLRCEVGSIHSRLSCFGVLQHCPFDLAWLEHEQDRGFQNNVEYSSTRNFWPARSTP